MLKEHEELYILYINIYTSIYTYINTNIQEGNVICIYLYLVLVLSMCITWMK